MNSTSENLERREKIIAGLLWHGTLLASTMIGVGVMLGLLQHLTRPHLFDLEAVALVKAGIALFILLPVARVALMLTLFLRERDYVYSMISGLVLAIIATSVLAGL
jgi:uncharacterized membrane protein